MRSDRAKLCKVIGDLHDLREIEAWKRAEAKGIPVHDPNDFEPEFRGEQHRDLPISERLAAYKADKNDRRADRRRARSCARALYRCSVELA